jgi:hypothetical protein
LVSARDGRDDRGGGCARARLEAPLSRPAVGCEDEQRREGEERGASRCLGGAEGEQLADEHGPDAVHLDSERIVAGDVAGNLHHAAADKMALGTAR